MHDKVRYIAGVKTFITESDLVVKNNIEIVKKTFPLAVQTDERTDDRVAALIKRLGKCEIKAEITFFGGYNV